MDSFLLIVGMAMCVLVLLCLYRVTFGPNVLNRTAAISAVGTKTLILLLFMGEIYGRVDMFVDISMVYALLNFLGTLVLAKYIKATGEVECQL
ncbi:MAG: pH regulation protein F [Deltaproteobacteria bacterium]|nr:pH regulation protein F [Deltaproteobacteria bacterium]MBW2137058.1 pH regulation protein F [Deltaproteobacteria bacterium]